MTSKVLGQFVDDCRPILLSRRGAKAITTAGPFLEAGGGSHATCIVNDHGTIIEDFVRRVASDWTTGTARFYANESQIALAEIVSAQFEDQDARVYFTNGGTEAFETALRIALHLQRRRGARDRSLVIGHRHSYHGMSVAARNAGDHPEHGIDFPSLDYAWPKLDDPAGAKIEDVENLLAEIDPQRVAAIVIEPVSGTTGGACVSAEGYLEQLAILCRSLGIILIVDEVVTAFGRTGTAAYTAALKPDILLGGKCLAAGYAPIGAVILGGAVCAELRSDGEAIPLRLTFAGNPLSCHMAVATQDYIARHGLVAAVARNGRWLGPRLESACRAKSSDARVCGLGHLWGIHQPVALGEGARLVRTLRRRASEEGIEFMGGWKGRGDGETVHMVITPAFDLLAAELEELVEAATDFFFDEIVTA